MHQQDELSTLHKYIYIVLARRIFVCDPQKPLEKEHVRGNGGCLEQRARNRVCSRSPQLTCRCRKVSQRRIRAGESSLSSRTT